MKLTNDQKSELRDLERHGGGIVTTDSVWQRARDPNSKLHGLYNWDVAAAAVEHWRSVSRQIIQVYVEIQNVGGGHRRPTRVYVTTSTGGQRAYQPTVRVLRENRVTLINRTLDRLVAHIQSYPLPEFDPILSLIDQIRVNASAPRPRHHPRRSRTGGRSTKKPIIQPRTKQAKQS